MIDGVRFRVTPNLHDGLTQVRRDLPVWRRRLEALYCHHGLRSKWRKIATAPLWVDAICFNQADIGERNTQVNMMARIYTSARAVFVWLGAADQSASNIVKDIRSLAPIYNGWHEDLENGRMKCGPRGYHDAEYLARIGCSDWTPQRWNAVLNFL